MLNIYVINEPVKTMVFATSMKTAVGVYLNDVIKESQFTDDAGKAVLSLFKTDEPDAVDILNASHYFDDNEQAWDAVQDALHNDMATIYVLDDDPVE